MKLGKKQLEFIALVRAADPEALLEIPSVYSAVRVFNIDYGVIERTVKNLGFNCIQDFFRSYNERIESLEREKECEPEMSDTELFEINEALAGHKVKLKIKKKIKIKHVKYGKKTCHRCKSKTRPRFINRAGQVECIHCARETRPRMSDEGVVLETLSK